MRVEKSYLASPDNPMREKLMFSKRIKLLLVCAVISIVLASGFVVPTLSPAPAVVSVTGDVKFEAETQYYSYRHDGCVPQYFDTETEILSPADFNQASDEINGTLSKVQTIFSECVQAVLDCISYQYSGGTCSTSDIYNQLPSIPFPGAISLRGYVADVELLLNNERPLEIMNVTGQTAKVSGQQLGTSFVEGTCVVNCHITGKVTLTSTLNITSSDSTKPITVTLTINAKTPVVWGFPFWALTVGMAQKTIVISLGIIPFNSSVRLVSQERALGPELQ